MVKTVGEMFGSEMLERANGRETVSQGSEKFCCCLSSISLEGMIDCIVKVFGGSSKG